MNLFGIVAKAEAAAGAGTSPQPDPTGSLLSMVMMIVFMGAIFYFMIIRPQKKRDKETKAMLDAMKVGDKIVTIGGICGKVVRIKDSFVFIETGNIGTQDEKSVIKMERSAVKSVETKHAN